MKFNTIKNFRIGLLILWIVIAQNITFGQPFFHEICSKALAVSSSAIIKDTLKAHPFNYSQCNSTYRQGLWYKFIAGKEILKIQHENFSNKLEVELYKGSCDQLICIGKQNDLFNLEFGKEYFLFVNKSSTDFEKLPFKISLIGTDLIPYQSCENAFLLHCGNSLKFDGRALINGKKTGCREADEPLIWVKLIGTGENIKFNVSNDPFLNYQLRAQIFKGNCENLECVGEGSIYHGQEYTTSPGISYIIGLRPVDLSLFYDISIACKPPSLNQSCGYAEKIQCGEKKLIPNQDNPYLYLNDISNSTSHGYWYKFEGIEGLINIEFSTIFPSQVQYYIYESELLDGNCFESQLLKSDNKHLNIKYTESIQSEKGKVYYIKVSDYSGYNKLSVGIKCDTTDVRNLLNYQTAGDFVCNRNYNLPILYNLKTNYEDPDKSVGYWFKVNPTEVSYTLHSEQNWQMEYSIYKFSSDKFNHFFSGAHNFQKDRELIFVRDAQPYWVRIVPLSNVGTPVRFSIKCNGEDQIKLTCGYASELVCDSMYLLNFTNIKTTGANPGVINPPISRWFSFRGNGQVVQTISSNKNVYYKLFKGDCAKMEELPYSVHLNPIGSEPAFNNELIFYANQDTPYLIQILNNSNTEEPVGIRFQCKFPISNNICAKALNIFSDTIMTIPLQNAANDFGGKDCNLYNRNLWYKITGNGKLLTINIKDGQRAHLSMYKGSCSELDCILSTQTGTLNFIAEEGEEYYVAFSVVFANYPTAEFNFQELTGTSYQNYQIAQCNDKMLIDVKESVSESYNEYNTKLSKWYGIVGQGKFTRIVPFENNWILANCAIYEHNIQNKIFDQSLTDTVTLYLKNNVLYLFNFTTVYDRQEYFLECMDIPTGNECNSAVQIGCDDKAYYPHKSERTNTVEDGKINYNSSWYKIIGDGKVYEIKPRYNSSVWNKVSVFRTMTNCNNLEKIKTLENHDFPIGILCEEGFSYFIQLSSTLRPVELDFVAELDIKCYEKPAKPFCEDAEFISCNRQISIYNTDNIIDNKHRYGLPSSGIWMRLIGSDQFYSLHFNKNIFPFFEPISVFIYSGSCNELKFEYFRSIEVWDRTDNFTFETKAGRQYFIFVSGAYIGLDFEVKCHTQNVSVFCDKPLEFKCGDELEWSTVGLLSPEEVTIPECDNAGKGNGVYYYFIGNGQQINFHIDNLLNRNIKINQSGATCNDECNVGYLTPDQKTVSLSTKPGLYYTLKFSGEHEKHYKVQTTCEDRLWNSECKLADEITCGQIISCRFNTPVNYSSYFPEYFYDHKSAAYWYKLPRIDKAFRVKPLITGFSAYTLTIIRGDCTSLTCVQRSSSRVSDLVFTIESSQQYYLVIQGLINDNRNYDFVLECIDLINNIECSKAEQIQCNQILRYNGGLIPKPKLNDCFNSTNFKSIWFTFTGDGKEKILYYNTTQKDISTTLIILKGTGCDPRQNTQIYYMDNLSYLSDLFLTENGVKYFVHLQLSENLMDDFDFGFYCRGNEDHLACKNAQPLNPDDNIEFDYLGYPMTILKYNSSGNNVLKYRVVNQWYKVRGADSIFYIINESDETISLFFFKDDCNINNIQYHQSIIPGGFYKFYTHKNTEYFLSISADEQFRFSSKRFKIKTLSAPSHPADFCKNEIFINCGDSISLDVYNLSPDNFYQDADLFLNIKGNDKLYTFRSKYGNTLPNTVYFTKNCDDIGYRYFTTHIDKELKFFGHKNEVIKINNIIHQNLYVNAFCNFSIECEDGYYSNNTFESASPLECGENNVDARKVAPVIDKHICLEQNLGILNFFIGDGTAIKIKNIKQDSLKMFMILYTEPCVLLNIFEDNMEFYTVAGQTYYLRILIDRNITDPIYRYQVSYNCTSSISEIKSYSSFPAVSVSPNPINTEAVINIQGFEKLKDLVITIKDNSGKPVYYHTIAETEHPLKITVGDSYINYPGVYFVEIRTNHYYRVFRIVKL